MGKLQINGDLLLAGNLMMSTSNISACSVISVKPDSNAYGQNLIIGAGGNTVIGGGESASDFFTASGIKDEENLYLTADDSVHVYTNCQSIANGKLVMSMGADGNITTTGTIITPGNNSVVIKPAKHNYDQIGASDCKFWKIHATTFYGNLSGNADTATTASAVAWGNVTGKPSSFTPASHTHSQYASIGAHNNLTTSGNEFTFASSAFSGTMYINYRTASGNLDGNITRYKFQNGSGSNTAIECSYMYGTAQAADYATSAGNADTVDGHHFHWDGQSGQPGWLWGGNDSTNMYVYNPSNFSVNYANSAGSADTVDGHHFHWDGQSGQPGWLWGGNDSTNMYVYNPSNFSVNYANSAGSANIATTANNLSSFPVSYNTASLSTSGWYKVATVTKDNGSTGPVSVLLVLGKNYNYSNSDMFTILVQGGYYNTQFIPIGHCDNGIDAYTQIRSTGDGANDSFDIEVYINTPSGGNNFIVKAVALMGSVTTHAFTAASGSVMKTYQIQNCTHNGTFGTTDPNSNPSAIPGYGEAGAIYYKI